MSTLEDKPQEYHEQRNELIEQAAEAKQEEEAKHNALLEAAKNGEEAVIEEFEETTIGDAILTVHTQIPGKVMRKLDEIYESDLPPGRMLDVYVDVLTEQTERIEAGDVTVESNADIRLFFKNWIDNNDAESAAMVALERVVEEPNELEQDRRQEAMKSFPAKRHSGGNGSRSNWVKR